MTEKARQGRWPTLAPVGYRNVWTDVGGRTESIIVIDEPRAKLVREAFWLYASGDWSLATLAEEMGGRGLHGRSGKALPRSKMAELLKNRAYIGKVGWKGVQYQGIHDPLVSVEVFERVQEVFRLHDRAGERQEARSLSSWNGLLWLA